MYFETRKGSQETKSGQRLTSDQIRELFERYGSRERTEPVLTKPEPDQRELSLSER